MVLAELSVEPEDNKAAEKLKVATSVVTTTAVVVAGPIGATAAVDAQAVAVVGMMSCVPTAEKRSLANYRLLAPAVWDNSLFGVVVANRVRPESVV